jgi:hypothetical protein
MSINTKLQVITWRAEEECLWLYALLTDEEMNKKGSSRDWSIKDAVAHISHWYGIMVEDLAGPRDKGPADYGDFIKVNDKIFNEHKDQGWPEIKSFLGESIKAVVDQLSRLTARELNDPNEFKWTEGKPLWRWVAGIGYNHAVGHLCEIYQQRGQPGHAVHLRKRSMHMLNDLVDDPTWHGINNYNIACAYSLAGEGEKGIPFLKTAFRENPGLRDWAKEDKDLESIHNLPGFKALYG